MLADGRLPTGGHAHSGGWESITSLVSEPEEHDVLDFVELRLATSGASEAAFVGRIVEEIAAGDADADFIARADAELHARICSPAQRMASRSQGRQWIRIGALRDPVGRITELARDVAHPHLAVGFAVTAGSWGVSGVDAATIHLHHLISGVATAAIRLHGFDPSLAARLVVSQHDRIGSLCDPQRWSGLDLADLPSRSNPLVDLLAESHRRWDIRMFRS